MFLKDAGAEIDYRLDWSAVVVGESQLEECNWSVTPDEDGGLRVVRSWTDGGSAAVVLAGGIPGHVYRAANRVVLSDGCVDERSIVIRVEER